MKKKNVYRGFESKVCKDHKGNKYKSIKEKCEAYGIEPETYSRRIKVYGMSEEEALTKPVKKNGGSVVYDHTGMRWKSFSLMCEHWGQQRKTVQYRLNQGWDLERALTQKSRQKHIEE